MKNLYNVTVSTEVLVEAETEDAAQDEALKAFGDGALSAELAVAKAKLFTGDLPSGWDANAYPYGHDSSRPLSENPLWRVVEELMRERR